MRISDIIAICWRNLTRRKLRTALTAFGVVIGVCAILVMISIGIGLQAYFDQMLAGWGDLTMITVNDYSGKGKLDDAAVASFQSLDGVELATPFWQVYDLPMQITARSKRFTAYPQLYGVSSAALEKMGYELESGTYFQEGGRDYDIVVGSNFAYRFRDTKRKSGRGDRVDPYPDENGVIKDPFVKMDKDKLTMVMSPQKQEGKDMEIKLNVTGVLKRNDTEWLTSEGVFMEINQLKTLVTKYRRQNGMPKLDKVTYEEVKVKCIDIDKVAAVQKQIQDSGFDCYSMEDSRKSMQDQANMIQLVLGGLAAISLFVAAIGIANTMVMSIIERTREIGIMKVIGAEVGNIRVMFLMEAGMIGLIGGVVGVMLSYAVSYIINTVAVGGFYGGGGQISIIPPWLVIFALGFSMLIGVLFGFLPANRAVKISALEAIKHD